MGTEGGRQPLGKRSSAPIRRVITRTNSSITIPSLSLGSKVKLEKVLGVSATSNNSFTYDSSTGTVLYTAGCVCVLYNTKTGAQRHIKNESKKALTCAAFSDDGSHIVTGESGNMPQVRVWDRETGKEAATFDGHKYGIACVSFSPNSKVVVSVGFTHDRNVFVWNWRTGKMVASNRVNRVFGMAFSPLGTYFVTVGVRLVKFWYFDTNSEVALSRHYPCESRAAILDEHRDTTFKSVMCGRGQCAHLTFCLTTDGRLFSFGEGRRVERWLDLKVNDAFSLYVTEDLLLCGCSDGVIRVFDPASLTHYVNLPKPHPLGVILPSCTSAESMVERHPNSEFPDCLAVVVDRPTNMVVSLYRDKSLYVWDISDFDKIGKRRSYLNHSACICAIEVYPQGEGMCLPKGTFITGSSDNTIKIWNLDPSEKIPRNIYSKEVLNQIYTDMDFSWLRPKKGNARSENDNGVTAISTSPNGELIACGDKSGNLRVYDLLNDSREMATIEAHDAEILSLSWTSTACYWQYLASASRDRLIHIFDINDEFNLIQTIADHSAIVTSVKFVEKPGDAGLYMLSCSADKSLRFRSGVKAGNSMQFSTYQHVQTNSKFNDMEIPQSRATVTTGCQDRQIRSYDIATGKQVLSYKSGEEKDSGMIVNVAIDPSGSYLAAAGSDKCIFIHDSVTGERLASLSGHSEMITGLVFTNDCKRLLSISGDGCIFVWRISNDVVRSMASKAREKGFEPELSAETPVANKRPPEKAAQDDIPEDPPCSPLSSLQPSPSFRTRKTWSVPNEKSTVLEKLENMPLADVTPTAAGREFQLEVTRSAPDGGEKEEEEEEVEKGEEETIYPPPKVVSPNPINKRRSQFFDVQITPIKTKTTRSSESDEAPPEEEPEEEDEEGGATPEEGEEDEMSCDSFLKHKFSEINDSSLDLTLEESQLSPNSRLRHSMSRRVRSRSPNAMTNGSTSTTPAPDTSPAPSPKSPKKDLPPNLNRAREAVEEKISAKKREKSEELLQPVIVNHSSTSLSAASDLTNKSDTDTSSSHYMSVNSSKPNASETDKSSDTKTRVDKKAGKPKKGLNLKSAFGVKAKDTVTKETKEQKKRDDRTAMKDKNKNNKSTPVTQRRSEATPTADIRTQIDNLISAYETAEGKEKELKAVELRYIFGRLSTVFSPEEDPSAVAAERTANRILALVQEKLGQS